jgi:hypothetical protein
VLILEKILENCINANLAVNNWEYEVLHFVISKVQNKHRRTEQYRLQASSNEIFRLQIWDPPFSITPRGNWMG